MAHFVLLWNPESDKTSSEPNEGLGTWSCGNATGIERGDTVILRRTGRVKGIVGIGIVDRGSYEASWAHSGQRGLFVDIEWEFKSTQPIIARDDPAVAKLDRFWGAFAGGVAITEEDGDAIVTLVRRRASPTANQFVDHWATNAITNTQRQMLVTHYWSPEPDMHPGYMAKVMGWPNPGTSHLHYGTFAKITADAIGVSVPDGQDNVWLFAEFTGNRGDRRWRLRSDIREAVVRLGWHSDGGPAISHAVSEQLVFQEGERFKRIVTYRGRNSSVRDHCLSAHGSVCVVCGFDPGARFGSSFSNVIEVHHLDPVADSEDSRLTDPKADCRPLCPICHRLAHHGMPIGKCRSIDELKRLVVTT